MSGGGSSKPQEVKASEGEKAQAKLAQDQIGYYRTTYAPLEQRFLNEAGQDHSARISGQAATAANRVGFTSLKDAGIATAPVDTSGISQAVTQSRVAGWGEGRRQRDDGRLAGLGIGLGVTQDATRSLSSATNTQTNAAIDRARNAMIVDSSKSSTGEAIAGGLGSAAGMYLGYKIPQRYADKQAKLLAEKKAQSELHL